MLSCAVAVGLVLTITIVLVGAVTVKIVGSILINDNRSIPIVIGTIGKVFGKVKVGTQTPGIETIVLCYHMKYAIVGNTSNQLYNLLLV